MPDILEYRQIIDAPEIGFFLKGWCDEDALSTPNPNPLYWLCVRVKPLPNFSGETEIVVDKDTIQKFIDESEQFQKSRNCYWEIKCSGWGSYLGFSTGKNKELIVSGLVNKRWDEENNHLKFSFTTKVSVLPDLCMVLRELLSNELPTSNNNNEPSHNSRNLFLKTFFNRKHS